MAAKLTGMSRDLLIHPGETIADILEARCMSQNELALLTGVTPAYVSKVINGKKDISANFAMALEYALGVSKSFWLNLQANYTSELLELEAESTITEAEKSAAKEIKEIVDYLIGIKVIKISQNRNQQILALRKYFKISNLANLKLFALAGEYKIDAEQAVNFTVLGTWVRLCQVMSSNPMGGTFDKNKLFNLINELKCLIGKFDMQDLKPVKEIFQKYGITFNILQVFQGAPVKGYIEYRNNQCCLIISSQTLVPKDFWFALFHELGHIAHPEMISKAKFIDSNNSGNMEIEAQADAFARNILANIKF